MQSNLVSNLKVLVNQHLERQEFKELQHYFSNTNNNRLPIVISGLPGSGRTALAMRYLHALPQLEPRTVWQLDASNPETLEQGIVSLLLNLGYTIKEFTDFSEPHDYRRTLIASLQRQLSLRSGWVLLFNNAKEPAALEPYYNAIRGYDGQIIITTCQKDFFATGIANKDWYSCDLSKGMQPAEAIQLLTNTSGLQDIANAAKLAETLEYSPLSLSTASLYIKKNNALCQKRNQPLLDYAVYIDLFNSKIKELEESAQNMHVNMQANHYTLAQYAAITLSIKQLTKEHPDIWDLLGFCSLLHTEISQPLFYEFFKDKGQVNAKLYAEDPLQYLQDYSLLQVVGKDCNDNTIYHMHSTVQRIAGSLYEQHILSTEGDNALTQKKWQLIQPVLKQSNKAIDEINILALQALIKHGEVILEQQGKWNISAIAQSKIFYTLGISYLQLGNFRKSQSLLEQVYSIKATHYGANPLYQAIALWSFGRNYSDYGDHAKSKELLADSLAIVENHYVKDYVKAPNTLENSRNNYYYINSANYLKQKIEEVLSIIEVYYFDEHIKLVNTLLNIGYIYGSLGNHLKQKELLEWVLAMQEAICDKNHKGAIASTLVDLGSVYGKLGDYIKSKELLEQVLPQIETYYEKNHARVAFTLFNLGNAYAGLGDYIKSKELLEKALAIYEADYAKYHIGVAFTLWSLGNIYAGLQDHRKSKKSLERALAIQKAHYGKNHAKVLATLSNLEHAYVILKDDETSEELLEQALAIQKAAAKPRESQEHAYAIFEDNLKNKELLDRTLAIIEAQYGKDPIQVAATLANLGHAYGNLGDQVKNKEFLEQALAIKETHYSKDNVDGKYHIEVVTTLLNLGNVYGNLGDQVKSKELLERVLTIQEAHYGKDAVQVASTLINLGNAYGNLGDQVKKHALLERALLIYQQQHPDNNQRHNHLADLYLQQRNLTKATYHYEQAISLNPQDAQILYGLACCYHLQGQFDKANNSFRQALISKDCASLHAQYALFLYCQKRYEEAIAHCKRAIYQASDKTRVNYGILEKSLLAAFIPKDGASTLPVNHLAYYLLANCYKNLGEDTKVTQAINEFTAYLQNNPDTLGANILAAICDKQSVNSTTSQAALLDREGVFASTNDTANTTLAKHYKKMSLGKNS